jgi:hypothetical protein|tara:strand:+ start:11291 stop:12196 length:906 start_codon:yes stop_codon:yes gene_type:complete
MMNKTYPTIIMIILAAMIMPLFTPTAVAQEATATIEIQNCNVSCLLTVVISSPTSVSEYQIAIKVSNTINLVPSSTLTTGFMSGSSHLTLEGSSLDEHRWFNLQSQGGTVGRLTIPISNYAGKSIILDKVDLLDDDGNRIDVVISGDGNVDVGIAATTAATTVTTTITTTSIATSTSTNTVTSLSTRTSTATVTSTRTMMATSTTVRTATTTTTVASAQTTITQTVSSTSTAKVTAVQVASTQSTSTITNTQTNTETVEEGSSFGVYAIVFAVIAIILLGLAVLRQQREDLFTKLREKIPF